MGWFSSDKVPTIHQLQKPERLEDIMSIDREDDCRSCRWIGTGAFFGLSGWSYVNGRTHLKAAEANIIASKSIFGMQSRQAGLIGISLGLAYMGILRWTT